MESLRSRPLPLPPLRLPEKAEKRDKPQAAKSGSLRLDKLTTLPPGAKRVPVGLKKPKGTGYLRLAKVYGTQQ